MDKFVDLLFPMAHIGFWLLALTGTGCLIRCRGKRRRWLAWTAAVFLTAFVLFWGGIFLLDRFGLIWRNAPAAALCVVLLLSGWTGIVLTLACALPMEWPNVPLILRRLAKGLVVLSAAVVLLVTLWIGPMGIAFVYGGSERVVEYHGPLVDYQDQLLVERMEGFLSPDYSYYPYRGPLFRGTKRIFNVADAHVSPSHIDKGRSDGIGGVERWLI